MHARPNVFLSVVRPCMQSDSSIQCNPSTLTLIVRRYYKSFLCGLPAMDHMDITSVRREICSYFLFEKFRGQKFNGCHPQMFPLTIYYIVMEILEKRNGESNNFISIINLTSFLFFVFILYPLFPQ